MAQLGKEDLERHKHGGSDRRNNSSAYPLITDANRVGVTFAAINVALYSVISLATWAAWGGIYAAPQLTDLQLAGEAAAILAINLVYGVIVIVGVFALRPMSRPQNRRFLLVALVALVASGPRVLALLAIYTTPLGPMFLAGEWVAGFVGGFLAVSAGVLTAGLVSRVRREELQRHAAVRRVAEAVEELQTEEMRIRRMVADQLHGNLQYRMVTVTAGLDSVAADFDQSCDAAGRQLADRLRGWAETLEEIRESEVRSLSHAVFPAGVEISMMRAVEAMLHRLPPNIATSITLGPNYRAAIATMEQGVVPLAERLIGVYAVEEAVTNALKHGHATRIDVHVELVANSAGAAGTVGTSTGVGPSPYLLDVTVTNDGNPLPAQITRSGLRRHGERLQVRGGDLTLAPHPDGAQQGVQLHFTLPFTPEEPLPVLPTPAGASAN